MRYVSLFSGVEAASVAWSNLGWQPLAFAEVDEFPSAVLAHRFPGVPNLGNVCNIDWKEFHERNGAVDVLIGGSPCQSFSIAGGREGLEGESRLMYEYIRAVRDLVRASGGTSPRYIVWENVPGCLSSNKGRDFGCLLDELEECGYFLAWRTLDSQFARVFDRSGGRFRGPVPQRRRRVFLVGSLGGPSAADILFERSCLRGDHPSSREARKALAEHVEGRPGSGDSAGCLTPWDNESKRVFSVDGAMPTLYAAGNSGQQQQSVLTPWDVQSKRIYTPDGTAPTLQSGGGEGMTIQPIVLQSDGTTSLNGNGSGWSEEDVAYTLNAVDHCSVCIQGNVIDRESGGAEGVGVRNDGAAYTLTANDRHAVAFSQNQRGEVRLEGGDGSRVGAIAASPDFGKGQGGSLICQTQYGDVAGTLMARGDSSPCVDSGQNVVCMESSQSRPVVLDDLAPTLNASHEKPILFADAFDCRNSNMQGGVSSTLQAKPNGGHSPNHQNPVIVGGKRE